MNNYPLYPLTDLVDLFDKLRKPVSQVERNKRPGKYPYFGATGQVGWIDDYRQDGKFVLLGEDGAPFLDPIKPKAYIVEGKCWVNNHAHVLKAKRDICDDDFLCFALNWVDYTGAVTGSTRLKLPQNTMHKLLLPTPPLEQQRRIAAQLKARLAEVDKARQAAEVQLREVGNLVARYREEALAELGNISRVPLGELLFGIEAGKSFKTTELPARNDELGILKVSAVSWNEFRPQEAKAVEGDYQPEEKHRVQRGDLIISRANTLELVGAVVRVEQDYPFRLLSDKTLRLVVNEEQILPDCLLAILQWPEARAHIEHNATGTSDSMRNISQKTIKSIPIPVISKKRQREIIEKSVALNRQVRHIEMASKKSLSDLDILPQKILAQAFKN